MHKIMVFIRKNKKKPINETPNWNIVDCIAYIITYAKKLIKSYSYFLIYKNEYKKQFLDKTQVKIGNLKDE